VTTDVADVLEAFGVRRCTDQACHNIERALRDVGLRIRPALARVAPQGEVTVSIHNPEEPPDPDPPAESVPVVQEHVPPPPPPPPAPVNYEARLICGTALAFALLALIVILMGS
jgi:hypothetical protein